VSLFHRHEEVLRYHRFPEVTAREVSQAFPELCFTDFFAQQVENVSAFVVNEYAIFARRV
jgi:hypothetical protein